MTKTWGQTDAGSFACDQASGLWLSPLYYYDNRIGWYEILAPSDPPPSYMVTAPNVVHSAMGDLAVGSPDYQAAQAMGLLDPSISTTGPGSNNEATVGNNDGSWLDLTNLVNVLNNLNSNANSGNTTANNNTAVGSAVTGAATVVANLINLLSSAWSWANGNLNFFMQNILGNQSGNILLNPTVATTGGGGGLGGAANVTNTGPNSTNSAGVTNSNGLTVKAQNSGNITNNVDLNAQSGNAAAANNTEAGNVSSGNATAEANIVNLINSFISSGSSFFGVLNILGNLNGNILFPSGFLNGLIGSSPAPSSSSAQVGDTGPNSNNQASVTNSLTGKVNTQTFNGATNNVQTDAASGTVGASNNTKAGSLQSGQATTSQSLFNLANDSIFGDNAVLVIVNDLGHWFGKIMNLPGGSTESALLTGNATVGANQTGPGSTNNASVNNSGQANVNEQSNGTITNNVDVGAHSGSANANNNTTVGNITSGNADATSSIANLFNTVLNVKHWFGVLVINVFGNWTGNVGVGSGAGDPPAPTSSGSGGQHSSGTNTQVAAPVTISKGTTSTGTPGSGGSDGTSGNGTRVLAAATAQKPASLNAGEVKEGNDASELLVFSALILLVGGALTAIDGKFRKHR